jgi:hypothetical protein
MAPLRGTLKGTRGETSRLGHKEITATLSPWEGRVTTTLRKDGTFAVEIVPLDGHGRTVAVGNVNGGGS